MTTYELWLFESKPQPDIGGTQWTLGLKPVNTDDMMMYNMFGGVRLTDGPYTHKIWPKCRFSPVFQKPVSPFEHYAPLGVLDALAKLGFDEFFHRTEAGPGQFFVVRFFAKLAQAGILGWDVVREWKGKARYCDREWEAFLERYTTVDQAFLDGFEEIARA
ncbi:hypothetical protein HK57_00300 [Aspergillus ustus]|uniref:Uncharacterized protein n=1 Tax=Aspergillus ustus TaxID=40382 RepID=A0A0C1C468_ASPUT|nr:hypothetical protein HK57_00300 [Aspergillus ustus]